MKLRSIVLLTLFAAAACSEPLEFADWTIPVPEGTRIIEYDDALIEGRDGRIELVEDLVVGARGEDPNYLFFRPLEVAVDSSGRMYVLDLGNRLVQVFDSEGEHLRTLGQEGQGPGEFQLPFGLTIAGDRVIVSDMRSRRLSIWDLEGAHLVDVLMPGGLEETMFGTGAGSIVGAVGRRLEDQSSVIDVALFSIEGTETVRYASLPESEVFRLTSDRERIVMSRMSGGPSFTAAPSGRVYATVGEEYQVLAFDASGSPLWALRAARPRRAFGEEHKNAVLESLRDRNPDVNAMKGEWPEFIHTIGRLAVDGHGHLYVFPYVFRDMGPDELPVEVYSPEGERLFAGTMSDDGWSTASGDFVYSLRRNQQTEEQELVRYRLIEPF